MTTRTTEGLYATGHWLLTSARYAEAAQVFRAMLMSYPADERGWLALGACHEAIGQHRIAVELYGVGATVASSTIRCAIARGRALRAIGRDDDAVEVFSAARELAFEQSESELAALAAAELVVR
ncbi:MAG: hypothetical protein KIT84_17835 [Labilithrix sp.]|nr:hypothetical protein [Labilithrix sp.]MCW5812895.1 hypothetical protein [Labilithrix sp.]